MRKACLEIEVGQSESSKLDYRRLGLKAWCVRQSVDLGDVEFNFHFFVEKLEILDFMIFDAAINDQLKITNTCACFV